MPADIKTPSEITRSFDEQKQHFQDIMAIPAECISVFRGEISIRVPLPQLQRALTRLKDSSGGEFTQLSDITAVDFPERPERFELIYQLLSVKWNQRVRLLTTLGEGAIAPSVTALFNSANWAEREIWDMFGIFFDGHGDLRRLLTDYGFEGHPLRKDFPLTGHVEVRYDPDEGRVVYEAVELMQEFRDFDYESPWEGMHGESVQETMRREDAKIITRQDAQRQETADD